MQGRAGSCLCWWGRGAVSEPSAAWVPWTNSLEPAPYGHARCLQHPGEFCNAGPARSQRHLQPPAEPAEGVQGWSFLMLASCVTPGWGWPG